MMPTWLQAASARVKSRSRLGDWKHEFRWDVGGVCSLLRGLDPA
jgi:hypothetical protein